jgi:hypothetical protein
VINAVVQVACDVKPQSHMLRIWLERKIGGRWETMFQTTYDYPPPRLGRWYRYTATLERCVAGTWRTRARATGDGPTGRPFSFEDTSTPLLITAKDCS